VEESGGEEAALGDTFRSEVGEQAALPATWKGLQALLFDERVTVARNAHDEAEHVTEWLEERRRAVGCDDGHLGEESRYESGSRHGERLNRRAGEGRCGCTHKGRIMLSRGG